MNKASSITNVFPIYILMFKYRWHIKHCMRVNHDLMVIEMEIPEIMSDAIRKAIITLTADKTFISYYSIDGNIWL